MEYPKKAEKSNSSVLGLLQHVVGSTSFFLSCFTFVFAAVAIKG